MNYEEFVGKQGIRINVIKEDVEQYSIEIFLNGAWHDVTKLLEKAPTNPAYSMIEWVEDNCEDLPDDTQDQLNNHYDLIED